MTRISGILESALYCEDLVAADAFYGGLLGLKKVSEMEGRHLFYSCGQGQLLVFKPSETIQPIDSDLPIPTHGSQGSGHLCFRASLEEIEGWINKFKSAGIEIESDFTWPNGARSIYVRDPGNNSIEFAEPKLWGFTP